MLKFLVPREASVYCEVLAMYTVMCTIVQLIHLALSHKCSLSVRYVSYKFKYFKQIHSIM